MLFADQRIAHPPFRQRPVNGFDAGFYNCDSSYANIAEAVVNYWGEVGIRSKLQPMERAAYIKAFAEKQYKNVVQAGPAAFGNAATRLETHAVTGGTFTYGNYPISTNYSVSRQVSWITSAARRSCTRRRIVYDRAIYAPIWQLAFINGVGPRVADSRFLPHSRLSLHSAIRRACAETKLNPGQAESASLSIEHCPVG